MVNYFQKMLYSILYFVLIFLFCSNVVAAQFDVNTTDDLVDNNLNDNVCQTALATCSLRAAVQQANTTPGPDRINLPTGTYILNYGTVNENDAVGGDLDIVSDIALVGEDPATTIIDGDGRDRIFHIINLITEVYPVVSISNVTLQNGAVDYADRGGGIYNQGSLTLSNVIVTSNTLPADTNSRGGGIYSVYFATLVLDNVTVSSNTNGGGIYSESYTYITNSTISNNTTMASGGGLLTTLGSFFLNNVNVTGNQADFYGGGLYIGNGGIMIDVTISNNSAYQAGGATLLGNDDIYLTGTLIDSNTSTCETGGLNSNVDAPAVVVIDDSTISNNLSKCFGGGLTVGGTTILYNSTVSGNQAVDVGDINPENGGGIMMAGGGAELSIYNSTIVNNEASGEGANIYGGTASLSFGSVTTSSSIIADPINATNCSRILSSTGDNIDSDGTCGLNAVGDSVQDPLVLALADNGGPTPTHALDATSPAIDGVTQANCPQVDQRGMLRDDGTCDIGAFEDGATAAMGSTVQFESASVTVDESAGNVTINVTRTGAAESTADVQIATFMNSSAVDDLDGINQDYDAVHGRISWDAGDTTTQQIIIPIWNDGVAEGDETFRVVMFPPAGDATLGAITEVIVTIADNDLNPGEFAFSQSSVSVDESVGVINVTVTRSLGSDGPASVELSITGGSATSGTDYNISTGILDFVDGETEKQVSLSIVDDTDWEQNETIILTLSNPQNNATLGAIAEQTITIGANDRVPGNVRFEQDAYTVLEDAGTVMFVVNRLGGSDGDISVDYSITAGSTSSSDYTFASGTLNFADGVVSQNISIAITDDDVVEGDETFVLSLQNPQLGAGLDTPGSTTVTIQDNDSDVSNSPGGGNTGGGNGGGGGGGGSMSFLLLFLLPLWISRKWCVLRVSSQVPQLVSTTN